MKQNKGQIYLTLKDKTELQHFKAYGISKIHLKGRSIKDLVKFL